jgi:hypothetical protein
VAERDSLSKEAFLGMAEASGLDFHHSHFEDLYAYLQGLLPTLKTIKDLDLTGLEPFMQPPANTKRPGDTHKP